MGRRVMTLAALAGVLAFSAPAAVEAQGIFFGGGVLLGVSDFGDATDPGFMGIAGFSYDLGDSGASIGAEGMYGTAGGAEVASVSGPDVDVYSAMGYLLYGFGDGSTISPYIWGGAGLLGTSVEDTDLDGTEFGYQGGVGLDVPLSDRAGLFFEGRYMGSSDVDMIGLLAGVGFGLGG